MDETRPAEKPRWPIWLGLVVLLGSIVTVAYAFFATWHG
jgi:hypothetical protein